MDLSPFTSNLFTLLFSAAVIHSFYLAVLLSLKAKRERGLAWLAIMTIPVALLLLIYLLYIADVMRQHPHLLGVFTPFLYMIGPAYYFFVRSSLDENFKYNWYDLLHLLPILYIIWDWWPLYFYSAEMKLQIIERAYNPVRSTFVNFLRGNQRTILLLFYVLYVYYYLKNFLRHSEEQGKRAEWLMNFTLVFVFILFLKLASITTFWLFDWRGAALELILILITAIAIHLLGYVVLGKEKVLPEKLRPSKNIKYATSPLETTDIEQLQRKLSSYLEKEKPWLSSGFSINELSTALNIPKHHLSQVFSEGLNQSFHDLMCQYRIEAVKQRLKNGDALKLSIQGIASECGFGSKSSFNRAFKKITGMTPSAWLKSNEATDFAKNR